MLMKKGGINLAMALSNRETSWHLSISVVVSRATALVMKARNDRAETFPWASAAVSFHIFHPQK